MAFLTNSQCRVGKRLFVCLPFIIDGIWWATVNRVAHPTWLPGWFEELSESGGDGTQSILTTLPRGAW